MKSPLIQTGAEANVWKIDGAHQGGNRRRREPGEDPTKEELVIKEQPLGSQRHSGKSMLTLDQEPTVMKRSINPSVWTSRGRSTRRCQNNHVQISSKAVVCEGHIERILGTKQPPSPYGELALSAGHALLGKGNFASCHTADDPEDDKGRLPGNNMLRRSLKS